MDISICWFRVIRALFSVSGVFIAEEVDGVRGKGSGNTKWMMYRHS